MAGTLTLSTLSDGTNSTSATNPIRGSARSWVNFNGVTTTTINNSFNVSSVTRNSVGDYTINFTTAMPNANYSTAGIAQISNFAGVGYLGFSVSLSSTAPTTSAVSILTSGANSSVFDASIVNIAVFSS